MEGLSFDEAMVPPDTDTPSYAAEPQPTPQPSPEPQAQGLAFHEAIAPAKQQEQGMSFDEAMTPPKGMSFQEAMTPESSALGAGAREAARNFLPTAAAAITGIGVGGPLSAAATPFVGVPAGIAAGALAAGGVRKLQDEVADALGLDTPEQRRADITQHPIASTVGGLAPAVTTFGSGGFGAKLAERALSGGIMFGADVAQQGIEKGVKDIDPMEAVISGAVGAALPRPRAWVSGGAAAGLEAAGLGKAAGVLRHDYLPRTADHVEAQREVDVYRPVASSAAGVSDTPAGPPGKAAIEGVEYPKSPATMAEGDVRSYVPSEAITKGELGSQDPTIQAGLKGKPIGEEPPLTHPGEGEQEQLPTTPLGAPERPPGALEQPAEGRLGEMVKPPEEAPTAAELSPAEAAKETSRARTQTMREGEIPRGEESLRAAEATRQIPRGVERTPVEPGRFEGQPTAETPQRLEPTKMADLQTGLKEDQPAGQQASLSAATAGEDAASKSKTRDALKQMATIVKSPVTGWRYAFDPGHLNEQTGVLENVIRGNQADVNRQRHAYDESMLELEKASNKISTPAERDEFIDTYQTGVVPEHNRLSPVAQSAIDANNDYGVRLKQIDPDANYTTNYLPAMFADPQAARSEIQGWREQNPNGSVPTWGYLRSQGLQFRNDVLRTDRSVDPIRFLQRYHSNLDKFLEGKRIALEALDKNLISRQEGPGLMRLDDLSAGGVPLYGSPEIATVWNRYFASHSVDPTSKSFYQTAQNIKNFGSLWQLSLSGYHFSAISAETIVGDVMRGINQLAMGKPIEAAKRLAQAPFAPALKPTMSYKAFKKALIGEDASPEGQATLQMLYDGGMSPERIARYTPELNSGGIRNYFEMWNKAAIQMETQEKAARIGQAFKQNPVEGVFQTGKEGVRLMGEALQSTMHPLFNNFIPRAKVGAAWDQALDWRLANPEATRAQAAEAGKHIWKSVEDRLGELNQSTLFWNQTLKKAANLLMISPGWETGTLRAFFGGTTDLFRHPIGSLKPSSEHFKPNAAYPFAFAITTAAINSIYQYLKTGKGPEDVSDVAFPRTGGKLPTGETERAITPGYEKDVWSWWHALSGHEGALPNIMSDAYNKLALVPKAFWDVIVKNRNWANQQIRNPSDPYYQQMQQLLQYAHDNMNPIGIGQLGKRQKGSNISLGETIGGLKTAPGTFTRAEIRAKWADQQNAKAQADAKKFRQKQDQKLLGYSKGGVVERALAASRQRSQPISQRAN